MIGRRVSPLQFEFLLLVGFRRLKGARRRPESLATIFYHVAISLGGYRAVQATETGQPVEVMPLWPAGLLPLATRP
jgi:hypothetical protein